MNLGMKMNSLKELINKEDIKTIAVVADSYDHFMRHIHAFLEMNYKGKFICNRGLAEFHVKEKRLIWCSSLCHVLGLSNWEIFHIGFKHNIGEHDYKAIQRRLYLDRNFRGANTHGAATL